MVSDTIISNHNKFQWKLHDKKNILIIMYGLCTNNNRYKNSRPLLYRFQTMIEPMKNITKMYRFIFMSEI